MPSNRISLKRRINTVKLELENQRRIRFVCSTCGKRFKVAERFAGKKGRCPCGNHIHIPEGEQTLDRIRLRHQGLWKVGLLVCGVVILSGIVWVAIFVTGSTDEPMDSHVPDKKVRKEVVAENAPLQRYEIKPDAPKDLWQKIMSIPQLAMERPFAQISYSEIQRQCERVLEKIPDSTEVRNIWEQVRFFEKCSWCRGLGSGTCKQCNGRGIQHVPNGSKEESLPIFTHADHKTLAGFSYRGGSLQECSLTLFSFYGVGTIMPAPLPDGLLERVKYIRANAARLYKCRNCSYYDMPTLFRAGRLKISYPKTYEWIGRTGTKITLRLQQEGTTTDYMPNVRFMKPLRTCPKCGRSEYIHKLPLTREVECNECGGKGKVDSCTVCQGSGLERLTEERKLTTPVLLNNHVTFEGIRIDFVGKNCTFTTMPRRHTQVLIHLYPGKYRMLLSWGQIPNIQGIEATPSFAVSEEIEVKHHATYMSRPVFSFSLHGQGNVKLTKVTRQEYDNVKTGQH